MTQKTIIFETDHVTAIEQQFAGDTVIVSFGGLDFGRNGLRFLADHLLLAEGISAIGIVTSGTNGYPRKAMDMILAVVLERTEGRRVCTFGQGHGGYGALKFAARLRASATLSFNPKWPINAEYVAKDAESIDKRHSSRFDKALGNDTSIKQDDICDRSLIFFDNMDKADAGNVARLAALRGTYTVRAPFSAHDTLRLVTEGGGAARLIHLCTRAAPPALGELRQVFRSSRDQSSNYLDRLLWHLIRRVSRSENRSSLFASRLLGRTRQAKPFYSALIAHASGNTALAHSELQRMPASAFDEVDLPSWWRLSSELGFVEAEEQLAVQILGRHPAGTAACLRSIGTLVKVGNLERAQDELLRLARRGDAAEHIDAFVEFSVKLRNPSVIEAILSEALPHSTKITVQFHVADVYRRLGHRKTAFGKLLELSKTCGDSVEHLKQLAGRFEEIGERSVALDIRVRLAQQSRGDFALALDAVEARIPSNKKRALVELRQLMGAPEVPPYSWERASYLYQRLNDLDAALHAIGKAVELHESQPEVRQRHAVLLARKGLTGPARAELLFLLAACRGDPKRLRQSGNVAFKLPDPKLGMQFAEAQFACDPADPACILYLAHHLRIVGDRTRAHHLLASLFRAQGRSPSLTSSLRTKMVEELREVGDVTLAKEAVAEALSRAPDDEEIRKLSAAIDLQSKFRDMAPLAAPRAGAARHVASTFASRLSRIFRK
jgi:thioredoxin-like negative regulator of GroEL